MAHRGRAGARRRAWRAGSAEMAAISRDRKCSVGLRSDHYRRNDTARAAGAMEMRKGRARVRCDGLTLVGGLPALPNASAVLIGHRALIRHVALLLRHRKPGA